MEADIGMMGILVESAGILIKTAVNSEYAIPTLTAGMGLGLGLWKRGYNKMMVPILDNALSCEESDYQEYNRKSIETLLANIALMAPIAVTSEDSIFTSMSLIPPAAYMVGRYGGDVVNKTKEIKERLAYTMFG